MFVKYLDLDWTAVAAHLGPNDNIVATAAAATVEREGHGLFASFVGLMLFQGVLKSFAGPVPNYDMQRLLSAKSPVDAAKISGFVNVALLFPRYLMIAGLGILAIAYIGPEWTRLHVQAAAAGQTFDGNFDSILPFALRHFMPSGLLGLALAGMLSAFMASYSASLNAAPAYVVNDIYKKYFRPNASDKTYVNLSYLVSFLFAALGTAIGWHLTSINDIVGWITTGLYGGYTAANLIKWYWWRMNGFGYFLSMATGVGLALAMPVFHINELQAFPISFAICVGVAIIGSLVSKPTDMQTLKVFYQKTRPWGFWKPVLLELRKDQPDALANPDMVRDLINSALGVIWQTAITASAIFAMIREVEKFAICAGIVILISIIMKFSWWDNLRDEPKEKSS